VRATGEEISTTLRTIIASRGLRNRFFPNEMFADPAWDILLDLARADADSQQVSVSSACIAASVPMSTALRWVRLMTEAGLLNRWTDPKDRRRDLIALTDKTASSMRDYLAAVHMMLKKV
jgi:DNA-binding MarR family transcriptional regulator